MLYPVVIVQDRYTGAYAGGQWIAVLSPGLECGDAESESRYDAVLNGALSDDVDAIEFWAVHGKKEWIAVGADPNAALANLQAKAGK